LLFDHAVIRNRAAADDKQGARLMVSRVVLDSLEHLELMYPKTDAKRRRDLRSSGERLAR